LTELICFVNVIFFDRKNKFSLVAQNSLSNNLHDRNPRWLWLSDRDRSVDNAIGPFSASRSKSRKTSMILRCEFDNTFGIEACFLASTVQTIGAWRKRMRGHRKTDRRRSARNSQWKICVYDPTQETLTEDNCYVALSEKGLVQASENRLSAAEESAKQTESHS
jgi:hypothetical protein